MENCLCGCHCHCLFLCLSIQPVVVLRCWVLLANEDQWRPTLAGKLQGNQEGRLWQALRGAAHWLTSAYWTINQLGAIFLSTSACRLNSSCIMLHVACSDLAADSSDDVCRGNNDVTRERWKLVHKAAAAAAHAAHPIPIPIPSPRWAHE